jgi:hypothetical protein
MVTIHDEDTLSENEGKHFMVDTYLIPKPYASTTDARIQQIAKIDVMENDRFTGIKWSCYYRSVCELTEETARLFTPICDISEMRKLMQNERGHYDKSDCVYGAHLAREFGFNWDFGDCGIDLVRINAEIKPQLKAKKLAQDMADNGALLPHDLSTWRIHEFEQYVFDHRDDAGVIEIYEAWRPRIEETREFLESHRSKEAYGQMSLFGDEDS